MAGGQVDWDTVGVSRAACGSHASGASRPGAVIASGIGYAETKVVKYSAFRAAHIPIRALAVAATDKGLLAPEAVAGVRLRESASHVPGLPNPRSNN